jgi:hypothetical protein
MASEGIHEMEVTDASIRMVQKYVDRRPNPRVMTRV